MRQQCVTIANQQSERDGILAAMAGHYLRALTSPT